MPEPIAPATIDPPTPPALGADAGATLTGADAGSVAGDAGVATGSLANGTTTGAHGTTAAVPTDPKSVSGTASVVLVGGSVIAFAALLLAIGMHRRVRERVSGAFPAGALQGLIVVMGFVNFFVLGTGLRLLQYTPTGNQGESSSFLFQYGQDSALRWMELLLCVLPNALMVCVTLIMRHREDRVTYEITIPKSLSQTANEVVDRVRSAWNYEKAAMLRLRDRSAQHAAMFGFMSSAALSACTLILDHDRGHIPDHVTRLDLSVIAVASATAFFFAGALGRILVRAAGHDATARMLAWSSRTLLLVMGASALFTSMLASQGDQRSGALVSSIAGAIVIGGGVAFLGDRALQAITDRAASLLGVARPPPVAEADLRQIEGIGEDDLVRLAEEGIDTIHALAMTPTARLFFNTKYSLQQICDWQDQALLISYVGRAKAQLFRDQLMVRGVLDAQNVAARLLELEKKRKALNESTRAGGAGNPAPAAGQTNAGDGSTKTESTDDIDVVGRALGYVADAQFLQMLRTLLDDELILRLRVHWKAVATELPLGGSEVEPKLQTASSDAAESTMPASTPLQTIVPWMIATTPVDNPRSIAGWSAQARWDAAAVTFIAGIVPAAFWMALGIGTQVDSLKGACREALKPGMEAALVTLSVFGFVVAVFFSLAAERSAAASPSLENDAIAETIRRFAKHVYRARWWSLVLGAISPVIAMAIGARGLATNHWTTAFTVALVGGLAMLIACAVRMDFPRVLRDIGFAGSLLEGVGKPDAVIPMDQLARLRARVEEQFGRSSAPPAASVTKETKPKTGDAAAANTSAAPAANTTQAAADPAASKAAAPADAAASEEAKSGQPVDANKVDASSDPGAASRSSGGTGASESATAQRETDPHHAKSNPPSAIDPSEKTATGTETKKDGG